MKKNSISLTQILKSDRAAYYSLILAIILWGLYILTIILGLFGLAIARRDAVVTSEHAFLFASIGSPPFLIFSVLRTFYVINLHKNSFEVTAEVVYKEQDGQGGFVHYQYEIDGRKHIKKIVVFGLTKLNSYHTGQKAVLLVNKDNPQKAIIKS